MPGSADRLLDLLEARKLLPQDLIVGLRRQIAEAPDQYTAHHVAKLLQRKGKITAFQARELLMEVGDEVDDARKPGKSHKQARSPPTAAPDEPAALGVGIDDLLDDPLLQSEAASADPLLLPPMRKRRWAILGGPTKGGKRQAAGWDSPLIIVGGGILLLLLLIGGALAFVLTRGSGDELLAAAEQDYLEGAYAQSISKYEKFAARHGSHPKASLARVRAGLAKLRLASGEGNWAAALQKAQAVLPAIETETAFDAARPELAAILPKIAHGFAQAASLQEDSAAAAALVEQFRAAMELIDNPAYLPASRRATLNAPLEKSSEQIALVVRRIEARSRLAETVAQIESSLADGMPMAGFALRETLLASYPRLHDDPSLAAAVGTISAALVDHVVPSHNTIRAASENRPSPAVAEIAPARASGDRVEALQGHVAAIVIEGVLYALSADEGLLLWRRFVGHDTTEALPVDASPGADLLVIDSRHHDLLRLTAADGELLWRLPVGEPFALGQAGEGKLWLTLNGGQLWEVDMGTGHSSRQARFPQPLSTAAVRSESGRVFVLGDHSNLYVMDHESLRCGGVFYLGHQRETIPHPPAALAGILVVPHQMSRRRSQLHALREIDDAPLLEIAQSPMPMDGHFAAPLAQGQLRIAAINRDGALLLLAVDPAEEETPLAIVANKSGGSTNGAAQLSVSGDYLLAAHNGLAAYRMGVASGGLAPRWINHKGEMFVGSLQVIGEHVIHARRFRDQAGVVIACTQRDAGSAQDSGRPGWETVVAPGSPKTSMTLSGDGERLIAYCATGDVFNVPRTIRTSHALNTPASSPANPGGYSALVKLADNRAMLVGDRQDMLVVGDGAQWQGFSAAALASADFSNSVTWRGGLLVPTSSGQVAYLPTSRSARPIHPFQPRLVIGEIATWLKPLPLGDDQFVATNQAGDVYLVGISREGALHLASLTSERLPHRPVAPPVLVGQRALLVTRSESHDALQSMQLPELTALGAVELPGRLRWGPHAIDDKLIVMTTPGGIQAYTSDAALRWSYDLAGEIPAGAALGAAERVMIATTSGAVIHLGSADGKELHRTNLAQPLADGPLVWGDRIALRAGDGTILLIWND